jgi:hypothetical protein
VPEVRERRNVMSQGGSPSDPTIRDLCVARNAK